MDLQGWFTLAVLVFVYGPGKYRFNDFLKTSIPLNLLLLFVAAFIIPFFWNF
jgi:di/tricarboxylate transporter